jgi:peptide/nickel transport system substrate-binding protein
MGGHDHAATIAGAVLLAAATGGGAWAQKAGGILKMYSLDNPPSMSILDGPNPTGERLMMAVFNNLVMFDQHVAQNTSNRSCPIWRPAGRGARMVLR